MDSVQNVQMINNVVHSSKVSRVSKLSSWKFVPININKHRYTVMCGYWHLLANCCVRLLDNARDSTYFRRLKSWKDQVWMPLKSHCWTHNASIHAVYLALWQVGYSVNSLPEIEHAWESFSLTGDSELMLSLPMQIWIIHELELSGCARNLLEKNMTFYDIVKVIIWILMTYSQY